MAEETGATGTQAEPETRPPAGEPESQADGGNGETPQPESISLEEAKKLRAEHQSLRKRLKAYEEAEKATKPAEERISTLEREKSDLERQVQELRVRETVIGTASRLGYADPADAFRLLDTASLEYADDGTPKDVEKALKSLLAAKPYLASSAARPTGSADAGNSGGRPASGVTDMNSLIRAARGQ